MRTGFWDSIISRINHSGLSKVDEALACNFYSIVKDNYGLNISNLSDPFRSSIIQITQNRSNSIAASNPDIVNLVEVRLVGGKGSNQLKASVIPEHMGRQEVRNRVQSGAVTGCHVIIAINKHDPNQQYMFHLNVADENPRHQTIGKDIIKDDLTWYLVAPHSSIVEYTAADVYSFTHKVEEHNNVKFDKTFYIIHPGERLYITYNQNGCLSFYDDYQTKAEAKIDINHGLIISPEIYKFREIIHILLAHRGASFLGVKKDPSHYNKLMNASTIQEIGKIARQAYLANPTGRNKSIVHPAYGLLQELTQFGNNQEKSPNSSADVIKKLKATFQELLKDVNVKFEEAEIVKKPPSGP